ncbi:MAG: hypothetical protein AB7G06_04945 [Bdellovibrionales bacterium]
MFDIGKQLEAMASTEQGVAEVRSVYSYAKVGTTLTGAVFALKCISLLGAAGVLQQLSRVSETSSAGGEHIGVMAAATFLACWGVMRASGRALGMEMFIDDDAPRL